MARFKRESSKDTIHADWWDAGETVTLKPSLTYEIQQKAARLSLKLPPDVSFTSFQNASAAQVLQWSDELAGQQAMLLMMIKDWTFRRDPTPEQEAAGQPGDLTKPSPALIAELDSDDFQFIFEEIQSRGKGVKVAAEAEKPGFPAELPDTNDSAG